MNQPFSARSPSLHPVLQAALGSLDVQLEVELIQYRCHQIVRRLPPPLCQVGQDQVADQINNPSNSTSSAKTELVTPVHSLKHTHLNLTDFVSHSEPPTLAPFNPEAIVSDPTDSSLTLEAYLEFSQSGWRHSQESKTSKKSKFLQRLWSPMAIAAVVSLLLSLPLSYLIIRHLTNLIRTGSETCLVIQAPKPVYLCNRFSALGDRLSR